MSSSPINPEHVPLIYGLLGLIFVFGLLGFRPRRQGSGDNQQEQYTGLYGEPFAPTMDQTPQRRGVGLGRSIIMVAAITSALAVLATAARGNPPSPGETVGMVFLGILVAVVLALIIGAQASGSNRASRFEEPRQEPKPPASPGGFREIRRTRPTIDWTTGRRVEP